MIFPSFLTLWMTLRTLTGFLAFLLALTKPSLFKLPNMYFKTLERLTFGFFPPLTDGLLFAILGCLGNCLFGKAIGLIFCWAFLVRTSKNFCNKTCFWFCGACWALTRATMHKTASRAAMMIVFMFFCGGFLSSVAKVLGFEG